MRKAERALTAPCLHDPPRITRLTPVAGPVGFVRGADGYAPNQSLTHSNTFPCMSWRPHTLAGFCAAGHVLLCEHSTVHAKVHTEPAIP